MKARFARHVALKGSDKRAPEAQQLTSLSAAEIIHISLRIRPLEPLPEPLKSTARKPFTPLSRKAYSKKYGAAVQDLELVADFAHEYGLSIVKSDAAQRLVELRGTVQQLQAAFRVSLAHYQSFNGQVFRGRSGVIQVPEELAEVVQGVFGLDNRTAVTPKFQVQGVVAGKKFKPAAAGAASFYPNQLASIYHYPQNATGKKQTIALIELGGGYRTADIRQYFQGLGIPVPKVVAIGVDGAHNDPSTADSADGEVMLDIEVAGAIAPGATLAVYFAPNTDKGFLDAITQAVHDTRYPPSVISISWGAAESQWTRQSLEAYNNAFREAAALGITVCAAAGDAGAADGVTDGRVHVDFPASSPYVLACGGTKLTINGQGNIASEVVWHAASNSATGGGVSAVFPLPDYQAKAKVPVSVDTQKAGRGVPDVAAVADPATGYHILVDGQQMVIGGTSAVAPLMAGLLALINEKLKKPAGFIHPKLYAQPLVCRDITEGNNQTAKGNKGYAAAKGWDACTGNGVPDGQQLLGILSK